MINHDQYSDPIATDDKWGEIDSNHTCYECAYNCDNCRCANVHEVDSQCNTCLSKGECLHMNPRDHRAEEQGRTVK